MEVLDYEELLTLIITCTGCKNQKTFGLGVDESGQSFLECPSCFARTLVRFEAEAIDVAE